MCEHIVERVLPDDFAQRRLGDLVDRRMDVFDFDHRLHRVDDAVVGDRGDVHAHVVPGDDSLRLDRHRHHTHGDLDHAVGDGDDQAQSWFPCAGEFAEAQDDARWYSGTIRMAVAATSKIATITQPITTHVVVVIFPLPPSETPPPHQSRPRATPNRSGLLVHHHHRTRRHLHDRPAGRSQEQTAETTATPPRSHHDQLC